MMSVPHSSTAGSSTGASSNHPERGPTSVHKSSWRYTMQRETSKPLPPVPLLPVRYSSTKPGNISHSPSEYMRRTSSVYSEKPFEWLPVAASWQSADLAESNYFPQPMASSASSPELGQQDEEADWGELANMPISFDHLVHGVDEARRKSSLPKFRPSVLLPPPVPPPARSAKNHIRTVSLEEARENMRAPGAVPMLPEELRAQMARPSSRHLGRSVTMGVLKENHAVNDPLTYIDYQGRDRLVNTTEQSGMQMTSPMFFRPYHDLQQQYHAIKLGKNAEKTMAPLADQARNASKSKAAQALGLDSIGESQKRTHHPSRSSAVAYSSWSDETVSSSEEDGDEEREAPNEYHSFLRQQSRQPSITGANFQDPFRSDLVPPPLFAPRIPAGRPPTPNPPSTRLRATTNPLTNTASRPGPTSGSPVRSAKRTAHSQPSRPHHGGSSSSSRFHPRQATHSSSSSPLHHHTYNLGSPSRRHPAYANPSSSSSSSNFPVPPTVDLRNGSAAAAVTFTPEKTLPHVPAPPRSLSGMVEGWKAGQAKKRREELKKRIRVVAGKSPAEETGGKGKKEERREEEGGFI